MRIGIISDTHGRVHPRVSEVFAGVDHILHAGDIGGVEILEILGKIAPVTAVAGNIDDFQCGSAGREARIELGGSRFFLTHIIDRPRHLENLVARSLSARDADIVVFGHSHWPHDEQFQGRWYFNPASAGPRRFDYPVSVGMFELKKDGWQSRHIALDERSTAQLATYMNRLSV
jgi:putative phosphoesterase